jgi:hypothetical protein
MNRLSTLLYSILICGLISCNGAGMSTEPVKAIERTDSCKSDPANSYEVYVPQRTNGAEKLPLLIILDAHGAGKFALDKFRQGANQYRVVLVASNRVKNGSEDSETAIQSLIDDVRQKYPIGQTVFMTGFSGAARMALVYSWNHRLNGLIMCGALGNENQLNLLRCPLISISGMDDFNFVETAQYLFQEKYIPANLMIELTNTSHSWPDGNMLADALGFLRLSTKADDITALPDSQLSGFCKQQQLRIDSLKQHNDFLKAAHIARNMSSTEPFNRDKAFVSTYNALKTNAVYVSQLNRLAKCLQFEISARQPYLEDFQTKDLSWWKNEISATDQKIRTEKDPYSKDMHRRIRAFWGIASYSICKEAIKQQNVELLTKTLSIYRTLEPQNADMFYFSAFPALWKGDNAATLSMLHQAVKAGFSDLNQLKTDFPASISAQIHSFRVIK